MRSCKSLWVIALLLMLIFSTSAFAQELETPEDAPEAVVAVEPEAPAEEPAPEPAEEEEEKCAFDQAIEDFECIPGLFTLYFKEDERRALLELAPEQLDEIYLCNITVDAGDGYYLDSGAMLGNFPFVFKQVGKKVQLIQKNVSYRADPESPLSRAIPRGVTDSVLASSPLVGEPHPETKHILVDAGAFFLQDIIGVGIWLSEAAGYGFDPSETYFGFVKSFPLNTEIEVVAHFRGMGMGPSSPAIPDSRSLQHRYRYSLCALPDDGYMPRLGDDRIGYFMTYYRDYDALAADLPYKYYIQRWRLEKKFPHQDVSPPKKPIVYWLENTIPYEYRDAVRAGILEWNTAFEKIGFKNAVEVKQMPDDADWDPADIRYNVVRWIVMPGSGYCVGPSTADPFTGELYAADIRMCADIVRWITSEYTEFVDPLTSLTRDAQKPPPPFLGNRQIPYADNYAKGKMREAAFGLSLLNARGGMNLDSPGGKQFVFDAIKDLATHEVGHTLGLRHNFKGSAVHTLRQMHDRSITDVEGVSGSVMDYNTANIAPVGEPQGEYWQTTLGTWDYFVIEYGYKPIGADSPEEELSELEKMAERSGLPKLIYGTDEDAAGGSAVSTDPLCNMWDMGSDPIAFFRQRIELGEYLADVLEEKFEKEGERYQKLRWAFGSVIYPTWAAAYTVPKYIGGVYQDRAHIGDPSGKLPFTPVPAAKQREAMSFLTEHVFGSDAFDFPPELMRKLVAERYPDFEGSVYERERVDYPLHSMVLRIQSYALYRLYDPLTLKRMVDLPLHYEKGEDTFTMAEMFQELRFAIWSEVYSQTDIDSFRRNLQREHLGILTAIVLGIADVPPDATSLARADMVALRGCIAASLRNGGLDAATTAHLDECLARIDAALEASMLRGF